MNKTIKKPITFVLALLLVLTLVMGSLTACGGKNKVLAEASGVKVKAGQVQEMANFLAVVNGVTFGGLQAYQQENITNQMTIFCVENELMKKAVEGTDVITDDVNTQISTQLEQLYSYSEDMEKNLKAAGVTEETQRYYLEAQYYSQAYYDKVTTETPVTDEQVAAYYEAHKTEADFIQPASIEVSHILVSDTAISDSGRNKAKDIRAKILDGEDFAALAEKNSDDAGSAVSGGAIGVVTEGAGTFVEPFETAALKLKKKGDISEIVETQFGFHILKATTDLTPSRTKTLEESTDQIKSVLQNEVFEKALDKLKAESKIKYNVTTDPTTGEPPTNIADPAAAEQTPAEQAPAEDAPAE
jgi:parvulin-like peptidyl-prolyl isomerase